MIHELDPVVALVGALDPRERGDCWTHLSLCVLDAVFSVGARYTSTTRTVWNYADAAGLADPLLPADRAREVIGTDREEPLSEMLRRIDKYGAERWMGDELRNRQRTSPRAQTRKAEAAYQYASVLVSHEVTTLDDAADLLDDGARLRAVEDDLTKVPGHGQHGIRLGYFWMLVGDDNRVKPDRMVLRWLSRAVERPVGTDEARALIAETARRLGCTPWAVDHALWTDERTAHRPRLDR